MKMKRIKKKVGLLNQKATGVYVRVSTEEQAKEGISVSAQKDRLIAFCKAKDLELYKIYCDEGFSAGSIKRPEFSKLLEDARNGLFSNILVYKIDRFSRNLKDLITILDELKDLSVNFISATEPIDTTSAIGNAFMQIIGVFAELERGMVAERVSLAFDKKAKDKEYLSRPPLGYQIKGKSLVIDYENAKIVKDIFESRVSGENYVSICARHKIPISTFYHIIKNPVYVGFIRFKDKLIKGDYQPIISKELFLLASNSNTTTIV
ncbi:MAG TPA: recombinase family protein [Candidatus Woesearchaeota archaeon]|nr:recombinase family protein [Candidatus Woesearchaeota archaeon]